MNHQEPPGRIVGEVVTGSDERPVGKASVRVVVDDVIVDAKTTNSRGGFNSRLLFSGTYRIEVDGDGLQGALDDVEVQLGEITNVKIVVS